MDTAEMRRRVRDARVAHLATVSATGQPHIVPICFVLIADTAYTAVDQKPKRTTRLRRIANIEATGTGCLLVDEYREDWSALWWVRLDVRGRLVTDQLVRERALDALAAKYDQYAQDRPMGPVLALDVGGWSGWSAT